MEIHRAFTEWAVQRGVKINGIAAHRFPGRGLGIIAEKQFKAGDKLLTVPTSAARTLFTVPKNISKAIGAITVHGLLAADLALDTSELHAPWRAVVPQPTHLIETMPLLWDARLQALLPSAAASLLANQQRKLSKDWSSVSTAFPALSYDDYVYNWLVVSTRTFYFTYPHMKHKTPTNRDDCIALNPFADYFNHADVGSCEVSTTPYGRTVSASQAIQPGDEIYISYGNHSNDFLLAEYGFLMDCNKWDEISLDEFMFPLFSDAQKEKLEDTGYWGRYMLDEEHICYRTQIALRILCMPLNLWQRSAGTGLEDGDKFQGAVNEFLLGVLKKHLERVTKNIQNVEGLDCGFASQRDTLIRRWDQMHLLINKAIERIQS